MGEAKMVPCSSCEMSHRLVLSQALQMREDHSAVYETLRCEMEAVYDSEADEAQGNR